MATNEEMAKLPKFVKPDPWIVYRAYKRIGKPIPKPESGEMSVPRMLKQDEGMFKNGYIAGAMEQRDIDLDVLVRFLFGPDNNAEKMYKELINRNMTEGKVYTASEEDLQWVINWIKEHWK